MAKVNLKEEEKSAISRLTRLSKVWPDSLWLFSASGSLCVMKKDENNNQVRNPLLNNGQGGGVDNNYTVATIDIENDGGDW